MVTKHLPRYLVTVTQARHETVEIRDNKQVNQYKK